MLRGTESSLTSSTPSNRDADGGAAAAADDEDVGGTDGCSLRDVRGVPDVEACP